MKIRPTNTIKLFVRHKDYMTVMKQIKENGVKFYPVIRYVRFKHNIGYSGYALELEKNHPIISYLLLKYDVIQLS